MNDFTQSFSAILGALASVALLLACAVLWARRQTPWTLVALIGSVGSMLCRLVLGLSPTTYASLTPLHLLWPLMSCVLAIGLLGHAWFETSGKRSDGTPT
jgi:Na+-transporting NADH:ubiquinone oxidoreductase subunit NqrB